ncbi:hypothetical protein QYF61_017589 [Mycteria americana]|uniref:Uncharacterized protein n=1 Tax=Mycteria americana TaxID=33587 RepID=A0AAN7S1L0_MYCAM|nr:hypothetical protein QYF61_017589 [Mycteria americana]
MDTLKPQLHCQGKKNDMKKKPAFVAPSTTTSAQLLKRRLPRSCECTLLFPVEIRGKGAAGCLLERLLGDSRLAPWAQGRWREQRGGLSTLRLLSPCQFTGPARKQQNVITQLRQASLGLQSAQPSENADKSASPIPVRSKNTDPAVAWLGIFIWMQIEESMSGNGRPLKKGLILAIYSLSLQLVIPDIVESDEVSPQPPFLQAEQPQVPQPLPISLGLQTLPQLRCPSLHTLQPLNVSLGVRGPTLNTAFEVRPHQYRVQGHDHCPAPAGHTIPDTSQDAIGFLGHLGTLLAHIQAAVDQHPQVLLCQAAFQPLFPKPVALHGVAVAQVQDLALSLVEPHTIDLGPWIQPVQPLNDLISPSVGKEEEELAMWACQEELSCWHSPLPPCCNVTWLSQDGHMQGNSRSLKPQETWSHGVPADQEKEVSTRYGMGRKPCTHIRDGDSTTSLGSLGNPERVPMLDNPFGEKIFPNIQSKPPLAQLEAISSRPITCYLGEETDPHLSTTSFQVAVESDEVSPQPPFLQAEQPQVPQPLPISLVLQTLPQLRCPSLDTLQPLNVSLGVRGPTLNTAFEVQPHQYRVQGHDHCPAPAGHTIPDTSQDALAFLATWAHCWLIFRRLSTNTPRMNLNTEQQQGSRGGSHFKAHVSGIHMPILAAQNLSESRLASDRKRLRKGHVEREPGGRGPSPVPASPSFCLSHGRQP